MKIWMKMPLFLGCYHLFGWFINMTVGRLTTTQFIENKLMWIFYLVPPVYMIFSGVVSLFAIVAAIFLILP